MLKATKIGFLADDALKLRAIGAGSTDEVYTSDPLSLSKLAAYWHTNEWGNKTLHVAVGFISGEFDAQQSYDFVLQVDALSSFGSPITVARAVVTGQDIAANPVVEMAVDVANMATLDANAGYFRLVMTPTEGQDQAFIDLVDEFLSNDAEFTLDDGTNGAESVKVGTPEVGTITFTAQATNGDIVTIDDGVNAPVAFEFGAGGLAIGADANGSAANLRAAINAAVLAGTLDVSVAAASDNVVTVTNLAGVTTAIFTDSAITETADPGTDMTIATFANGETGNVQPQAIIEHNGGTYLTQRQQIVDAINALASGSFSASLSGDRISIVNSAPDLGVSEGELVEVADAGNTMTMTDFAVAAAAVDFWAYVQGEKKQF